MTKFIVIIIEIKNIYDIFILIQYNYNKCILDYQINFQSKVLNVRLLVYNSAIRLLKITKKLCLLGIHLIWTVMINLSAASPFP